MEFSFHRTHAYMQVRLYEEDKFFHNILKQSSEFKNFLVQDGYVYLRDNDRNILCIPDIQIGSRRIREIIISYAHSILAHLGPRKTLFYLRDNVWWKDMVLDIRDFCNSCSLCQAGKTRNHRPFGLLNPLPVPSRPWETIGMDFVGPLPESRNRHGAFDMITVIIDHLTSMVHLVPSKQTYKARDIAELIFENVYKLHGLPSVIVSDRDSLFTSIFWSHLHRLIGTELRMSSSYHPQTDGATERANRTIVQMLRMCISPNQRDWVSKLPAVEFALNCARSETTGFSPFFLNTGRMPRSLIWMSADSTEYSGVRVYAQRMKDAIMTAHDAILATRVKQVNSANHRRRPAPFAEDDLVYLSTVNLRLPKDRARKLVPKFIGPYRIQRDFGNNSYRIDLPPELRSRGVHPVFHASLLRIHIPNDDRRFPGRQLHQISSIHGNSPSPEWDDVSSIISHSGIGKNSMFLVKWAAGDTSWLPYYEVSHLTVLSQYLEALGVPSVSKLPKSLVTQDSDILLNGDFIPKQAEGEIHKNGLESTPEQPVDAVSPTLADTHFLSSNSSSLSLNFLTMQAPSPSAVPPPFFDSPYWSDPSLSPHMLLTQELLASPQLQFGIFAPSSLQAADHAMRSPEYHPRSPSLPPAPPASPITVSNTELNHADLATAPDPVMLEANTDDAPIPTADTTEAVPLFHGYVGLPERYSGTADMHFGTQAYRPLVAPVLTPDALSAIQLTIDFLDFQRNRCTEHIEDLTNTIPGLDARDHNRHAVYRHPTCHSDHLPEEPHFERHRNQWTSFKKRGRGRRHNRRNGPCARSADRYGIGGQRFDDHGPGSSGAAPVVF